jgi:thiol-disulfide isomerase/thioredoxin
MVASHEMSPTSWKATLEASTDYVAVKFHAAFCGPCKIVAPIFDDFASRTTDGDAPVTYASADTTTNVQLLVRIVASLFFTLP